MLNWNYNVGRNSIINLCNSLCNSLCIMCSKQATASFSAFSLPKPNIIIIIVHLWWTLFSFCKTIIIIICHCTTNLVIMLHNQHYHLVLHNQHCHHLQLHDQHYHLLLQNRIIIMVFHCKASTISIFHYITNIVFIFHCITNMITI